MGMQGRWRKTCSRGNNRENKAKTVVTDEKHTVFSRQIGVSGVYKSTTSYANRGIGKSERYLYNTTVRAPPRMVWALFIEG